MSLQKTYHWILMIGSLIGLAASFLLTIDTFKLLKNPAADLPCNLNPFISCTSVTMAWQGSVFGFPNPVLGLMAFSMLFAIGVMLFSGGRAKKPLWLLVNLGTLAAVIFVVWFFFESVYRIGSLCIYCMTIWSVTWPIFLYTTLWNFLENHFAVSQTQTQLLINRVFGFIAREHWYFLVAWYLIIGLNILYHFRDFFWY